MKKTLLGLALGLLTITASIAQPHQKRDGRMQHMKQRKMEAIHRLHLTQEQKDKVKAMNESFKERMKALSKNENQTVKQLRDQREALMREKKAAFEKILTPEQREQMQQMRSNASKRQQEEMARKLERMKERLNLTEAQMTSIQQKQKATMEKMKALRDNDKLDRTARRDQMKALHEEMKKHFETVLTKEQLEQMKQHQQGKGGDHDKPGKDDRKQ